MNNNKYLFLIIEEVNGEYEYLNKSVHILRNNNVSTANKFTKSYIKNFYEGKAEFKNDGYYFHSGETFVKVFSWKFITEEHYKILSQYL